MFSSRAVYYALLSFALCGLGPALRQGGQLRGDTEPSMRDVREVAKAAEAAGILFDQLLWTINLLLEGTIDASRIVVCDVHAD